MAIDNKTVQINNFSGGMNTDVSDAYMKDDSYRYAENLRYITNKDSNSGELHMIEGVVKIGNVAVDSTRVIHETTQLRDMPVIICDTATGFEVYTYTDNKFNTVAKITTDRVRGKSLSLVTKYEDEDNQKLYIADGEGPMLCIQLAIPEGTTGWAITDINDIIAYPSIELNAPKFNGIISGQLKAGLVQYSYQLYHKFGNQSEISPATKLIPIYKGGLTVQRSKRIEGYQQGKTSDKGVSITFNFEGNALNFERMIIYRVTYVQNGQIPTIDIVYDGKRVDSFDDKGGTPLGILTVEEYNSMTGIHIIPKVIESKDDYMFAANIKDTQSSQSFGKVSGVKLVPRFVYTKLTGDVNFSTDRITIKGGSNTFSKTVPTWYADTNTQGPSVDLSTFMETPKDTNNTYANPYVSYALKSLRRGETYKYGLVLYDNTGASSGVIAITKVDAPSFKECPAWEFNNELYVRPLGIQFTVYGLEKTTATRYEIVRCGRSANDASIITQCVLSRPIHRIFEEETVHEDTPRPQEDTFPLTPTGWVTTMDCWYGVETAPNDGQYQPVFPCKHDNGDKAYVGNDEATRWATNVTTTVVDNTGSTPIVGNSNIFQAISPEYCYENETIQDLLKDNNLVLEPIQYIYPANNTRGDIRTTDITGAIDIDHVYTEDTKHIYNIGNDHANVNIRDTQDNRPAISINTNVDTMMCYYYKFSEMYNVSSTIASQLGNFDKVTIDTVDKRYPSRYSYIKLYNKENPFKDNVDIQAVSFPSTLSWDDMATSSTNWKLKYTDNMTAISNKNFVNWVSGGLYAMDSTSVPTMGDTPDDPDNINRFVDMTELDSTVGGVFGPGGKCFLLSTDTDALAGIPSNNVMGTYLCNVRRRSTTYDENDSISIFRSFGDYFKVSDGNVCTVFDGDCFIMPFEYISQHKCYNPRLPRLRNAMIVYSIPMETSINLAYTSGYEFSKNIDIAQGDITNIQVEPANVNNKFIQERPLYEYNTAYSSTPTAVTLMKREEDAQLYDLNQDTRVFHSKLKASDETKDSWQIFQPANFLDVDSRHGSITGLRKFHNQLVFWQENAVGLLSVNERAIIKDESQLQLILGAGGVLTHYDYINTSNGMKANRGADAQSDTTLYWWDENKNEICAYAGGQGMLVLSKIKSVQNFLNEHENSYKPIMAFDKKYNELLASVKNKGILSYSENTQLFHSVYNITPIGVSILFNTMYMFDSKDMYEWNKMNENYVYGFNGLKLFPKLKYVVNQNAILTKVFDNGEFGGRVYGGDTEDLKHIKMTFTTPLKQKGILTGDKMQNREYNFTYAIPRNEYSVYGDRLRGKTMQGTMVSDTNSYDFSLQFIKNKYRISWS